jgi:4-amino-4-deoxy-L-arabinose transferase-like glycosyltransferase
MFGLREKINKELILVVLIFLLAAVLRFYKLGENPPSLTWDEVAWGYNAYSLGIDGRDEFGRFLPWDYLESFGDFKPPVYAYLTILPVKIFGLNEFSTRFTSAFFGTLTVLLTFFLVKEIFKNSLFTIHYSLFTSFFLAISPWHVMLSRAAFEANVASFFIIGGVLAFLRATRDRGWWLIFSALSFSLSLQTFNTARIVSPFLVLLLTIGFRKKILAFKKWVLLSFLVGFIVLAPAIPFYFTPQAKLRFKEVNIFSDVSVVALANQEMSNDGWKWWSRIIHNRRWGYFRLFLRHYFDHFNPNFLFIKGDGNPKFSTQDVGQLYLWELPFLIWGTLILFRKKEGCWWIIPFWLLGGIIPAATARETPHALRIEATLPTWQILTAMGVGEFLSWVRKFKRLINSGLQIAFWGIVAINFVYFQHGYWRHYPAEFSGEWQYGYKPAIDYIKENGDKYDQIWFTSSLGRPYIYFLFYLKKSPQEFRQEARVKRDVFGFVSVEGFGKYNFFHDKEEVPLVGKSLIIAEPSEVPKEVVPLKTFLLLNGKPVLGAYEKI